MAQIAHGGARAGKPVADAVVDGQHRFETGQGFADNAREEARGGLVGLAGAHDDGGQADADAIDKPRRE